MNSFYAWGLALWLQWRSRLKVAAAVVAAAKYLLGYPPR